MVVQCQRLAFTIFFALRLEPVASTPSVPPTTPVMSPSISPSLNARPNTSSHLLPLDHFLFLLRGTARRVLGPSSDVLLCPNPRLFLCTFRHLPSLKPDLSRCCNFTVICPLTIHSHIRRGIFQRIFRGRFGGLLDIRMRRSKALII